jgi:hypothetical protein
VNRFDDITPVMLRFRESVRHIWNTYFQDAEESMGPEIQDAFTLVEQGLFQGIVLSACAYADTSCRYRGAPLPFVQVVPLPEMLDLSFQIGFPGRGTMAWDSPVRFKVEEGTKLEFVQFFDWNPYEQINMSLVQVHIARMDARPDLVGAHALLAEHEIHFVLRPTGPGSN